MTLAFLAEVPDRRLDDLVERLGRAAARRTAFPAVVAGGGAFPNPARVRVLYAGLDLAEPAAHRAQPVGDGVSRRRVAGGDRSGRCVHQVLPQIACAAAMRLCRDPPMPRSGRNRLCVTRRHGAIRSSPTGGCPGGNRMHSHAAVGFTYMRMSLRHTTSSKPGGARRMTSSAAARDEQEQGDEADKRARLSPRPSRR